MNAFREVESSISDPEFVGDGGHLLVSHRSKGERMGRLFGRWLTPKWLSICVVFSYRLRLTMRR